jgi:guanylate kinase
VSQDAFDEANAQGELIETQEVYKGVFYGTPRAALEAALRAGIKQVADIDVVGAGKLRAAYPENVRVIYVAPPSLQDLAERLRKRTDKDGKPLPETEIAERLKRAEWELTFADTFDYKIINADFDVAVEQAVKIVTEELFRVSTIAS